MVLPNAGLGRFATWVEKEWEGNGTEEWLGMFQDCREMGLRNGTGEWDLVIGLGNGWSFSRNGIGEWGWGMAGGVPGMQRSAMGTGEVSQDSRQDFQQNSRQDHRGSKARPAEPPELSRAEPFPNLPVLHHPLRADSHREFRAPGVHSHPDHSQFLLPGARPETQQIQGAEPVLLRGTWRNPRAGNDTWEVFPNFGTLFPKLPPPSLLPRRS